MLKSGILTKLDASSSKKTLKIYNTVNAWEKCVKRVVEW